MKGIGYFTDGAAANGSLGEQNRAFLEFCRGRGLDPGDTFVEPAGGNGRAPGFRQLVRYLRQASPHNGDMAPVVVISSVGAFGADARAGVLRCLQLEALGARVAACGSGADEPADVLLTAWVQRDDAGTLSERVRSAMRRKAVKGEVLGRPPYGYKVGARRRLELVPEEAVVVRYIFRLYLQEKPEAPSGMGIRLIARRLNEEGLKTRRGGNWSMVSIRDILRNRAYLGTYSRFGVRVPGSHPALVSADDFRVVQDRLNARRTSYAPRVTSQFLLSGIAHCGYCGNKLIGVSRRQAWKRKDGSVVSNAYRYYQCESRTNQSICGYHTRRAADLERQVHDALAAMSPAEVPARAGAAPSAREAGRLQAKLRAVERRIDASVAAAAKGLIDHDRLRADCLAAAGEHLAIEDKIEAAEQASQTAPAHGADGIAALVASWDATPLTELQLALRDAVERVTVTDEDVQVALHGG